MAAIIRLTEAKKNNQKSGGIVPLIGSNATGFFHFWGFEVDEVDKVDSFWDTTMRA